MSLEISFINFLVPLLFLRYLFDSIFFHIDSIDYLGVVVGDVQHLCSLVTGHAELLDQEDHLEPVLVRHRLVFALQRRILALGRRHLSNGSNGVAGICVVVIV